MTRTHALVAITLLAITVMGIYNLPLTAQEDTSIGSGLLTATTFALGTGGNASSSASMLMGILSIGPNPPAAGAWPCVGGGSSCPSVAQGGLVIGFPSIVGVPHNCASCAQIYFTFDTITATGSAAVTVEVKQGFFTLVKGTGSVAIVPNQAVIVTLGGFTLSSKAVPGDATLQASVANNGVTIRSSTPIVLD